MSLKQAITSYLLWKTSYAPIASTRYQTRLKHLKDFLGEEIGVSAISGDVIASYHINMAEQGYSNGTIAYSARILKNFFEFLNGRGENCLNHKEIRVVRHAPPAKELLTEADLLIIDQNLNEGFFDELIKKLAVHMLWDTGMRVSELCEISISDIEETETPGVRSALIKRRKSFRYDQVVWGKETNRLLNLYLGLRLCMDGAQTDALFVTRNPKSLGQPISTRTVQRWTIEITRKAGLSKHITPHCFRHSKAHRVLDKSENVRDVQAILGHVSPESSFKYLYLNKDKHLQTALKYLY